MQTYQQSLIPDLVHDKAAWFRYFDTTHRGLSFEQLMQALSATPSIASKVNVDSMRPSISELWHVFDHDRSGFIEAEEFLSKGGLADTILAQLPSAHGAHQISPPALSSPYTAHYTGALPSDYDKMLQHIEATLPGTSRPDAEAALLEAAYNPDLAVHNLIAQRRAVAVAAKNAAARPQPYAKKYPVVPQQQPPAHAHASTEVFRCFNCHRDFAVDTTALPAGVQLMNSTCPTCGTVNQVRLTRPATHPLPAPPQPQPQLAAHAPPPLPPPTSYGQGAVTLIPPTPPSAAVPIYDPHPVYSNSSAGTSVYAPPTAGVFRPPPGLSEQPAPPSAFRGGAHGTGRKKALLIGINYFGQRGQLKGCLNDVENVYRLLTEQYGWDRRDMTILVDGVCPNLPGDMQVRKPTRANILSRMRWLAGDCSPGDSLFLLYSGHGAQKEDPHGVEEDGMNETILPVDFSISGQITDDEISSILVQPLPEGVRLTAVMDCCHSGTGLDLPFTWTTQSRSFKEETNPYHTLGDVQLFSGCEDDGVSADAAMFNQSGGAMTTAFCEVLRSNPCPTYVELLVSVQTMLNKRRFKQRAQLSSSQKFDIYRPFLLEDAIPNSNRTIGRTMRRRFPPKRRQSSEQMNHMLGIGAMAAMGGFILGHMLS